MNENEFQPKEKTMKHTLLLMTLLTFVGLSAHSASLTFMWEQDPLNGVDGFTLYSQEIVTSGTPPAEKVIDLGAVPVQSTTGGINTHTKTQISVEWVEAKNYRLQLTAYKTVAGVKYESPRSTAVTKTIAVANPNPPTNLRFL